VRLTPTLQKFIPIPPSTHTPPHEKRKKKKRKEKKDGLAASV
jgi:hypothetical protein